MRWVHSGADGELFTISSPSSTTLGAAPVVFIFLQDAFGPINASFIYNATEIGTPTVGAPAFDQGGLAGSFSFTSTQAFTYNGTPFAAGTNLLSATFFNHTDITGKTNGTSGSVFASTGSGSTIDYSSAVLPLGLSRDFALALTQVTKAFGYVKTKALNDFTAASTGSFSASAVPEPATWGLMITGFGMMGLMARRRRADAAA